MDSVKADRSNYERSQGEEQGASQRPLSVYPNMPYFPSERDVGIFEHAPEGPSQSGWVIFDYTSRALEGRFRYRQIDFGRLNRGLYRDNKSGTLPTTVQAKVFG